MRIYLRHVLIDLRLNPINWGPFEINLLRQIIHRKRESQQPL